MAPTNQSGAIVEEYSYDAWGRRRNPNNPDDYNVSTPSLIYRGYTAHEHLDEFGLINMNGRVYDPITARFLSPDIVVQAPLNTQSYNRYTYCLNNPLKYTDPSGYEWYDDWKLDYEMNQLEPWNMDHRYVNSVYDRYYDRLDSEGWREYDQIQADNTATVADMVNEAWIDATAQQIADQSIDQLNTDIWDNFINNSKYRTPLYIPSVRLDYNMRGIKLNFGSDSYYGASSGDKISAPASARL